MEKPLLDKDGKEDKRMGKRVKEMKRMAVSLGICAVMAVVPTGAVNAQEVNVEETGVSFLNKQMIMVSLLSL